MQDNGEVQEKGGMKGTRKMKGNVEMDGDNVTGCSVKVRAISHQASIPVLHICDSVNVRWGVALHTLEMPVW